MFHLFLDRKVMESVITAVLLLTSCKCPSPGNQRSAVGRRKRGKEGCGTALASSPSADGRERKGYPPASSNPCVGDAGGGTQHLAAGVLLVIDTSIHSLLSAVLVQACQQRTLHLPHPHPSACLTPRCFVPHPSPAHILQHCSCRV